jgi:sugar lactone lactonase YvrE
MKFPTQSRVLCLLGAILFSSPALVHAQYSNGQSASYVLGQSNFTSGSANAGGTTNQSGFSSPTGIVIDSASGKLFFSDTSNNRILRFSSASAFSSGAAAEAVIGQANFTTGTTGAASASKLSGPQGIALDSAGNLWVADTVFNRVLCFPSAVTVASGTATATIVLGQPNFTTTTAAVNQFTMSSPTSVAVDGNGSLFVLDSAANRILRFDNAASLGSGTAANGLLGQSNFLSSTTGLTQSTLGAAPKALAIDSGDNLWVSDTTNNRVLCYESAASKANGANADIVLGQPDFTTGTAATSQSGFSAPNGLAFDILDRLYVADTANNRVLVFSEPLTLSFQAPASFVLGQTGFTTATSGTTQSTLSAPKGVAYLSSGYLWVVDQSNHRALSFAISPGVPSVSVAAGIKLPSNKQRHFSFFLNNSGGADEFTMQVAIPKGVTKLAHLTFVFQGADVTSQLLAGTFVLPESAASQKFVVKVAPTGKGKRNGGTIKFNVTATSVTDPSNTAKKTITAKLVKKP